MILVSYLRLLNSQIHYFRTFFPIIIKVIYKLHEILALVCLLILLKYMAVLSSQDISIYLVILHDAFYIALQNITKYSQLTENKEQ